MLLGLPRLAHAESIVASTRLYALALELIHERPDISYQFLISSVETIADSVLSPFQPTPDEKVQFQHGVYKLACKLGLQEEQARTLAIEACKPSYWATRKFKQFLLNNVNESIWSEQDDLFPKLHDTFIPHRDSFEKTLARIYDARSKATHLGQPFPVTASHAGGPYLPANVFSSLAGSISPGGASVFPPVAWFERVVHSAISSFWERSLMNAKAEPTPSPPES
jgi:hypothetical protein